MKNRHENTTCAFINTGTPGNGVPDFIAAAGFSGTGPEGKGDRLLCKI